MIGHYFKVVWNRKRANALILAEILVSFFVLCIVFSVVVYYAANWRRFRSAPPPAAAGGQAPHRGAAARPAR